MAKKPATIQGEKRGKTILTVVFAVVAVVYLLFCTVVTKLQSLLERQLNAHGFQ